MRRLAGTRKIGHAGTLDPMATGPAGPRRRTAPRGCCTTSSASTRSTSRRSASAGTRRPTTPRASRSPRHPPSAVAARRPRQAIRAGDARADRRDRPGAERGQRRQGRRQARLPAGARRRGRSSSPSRRVTVSAFELLAVARRRRMPRPRRARRVLVGHLRARARTRPRRRARHGRAPHRAAPHAASARSAVDEAGALEGFDVADVAHRAPRTPRRRSLPVVDASPPTQAVDLGHGKRVDVDDDAARRHCRPGAAPLAAIAPDDRLVAIVERRGDQLKVVTGFPPEAGRSA